MNNEIAVEKSKKEPSYGEFVALISLIMSLTALTIDVMLPSLPQIGSDLGVKSVNDRQLVVSVLFLGLAVGQLFFGPLSDKTGRKPAIYAGYAIFIAGALISVFALNFPIMLLGRLLQGIGISSPRAVSLALMSFVMTVFILVPMLAPSLGQAVLLISGWRSIFLILILIALITFAWFALRMPETLVPEKRTPFKLRKIFQAESLNFVSPSYRAASPDSFWDDLQNTKEPHFPRLHHYSRLDQRSISWIPELNPADLSRTVCIGAIIPTVFWSYLVSTWPGFSHKRPYCGSPGYALSGEMVAVLHFWVVAHRS